jgi:3-methyladenine DNA glycosylase AlkD
VSVGIDVTTLADQLEDRLAQVATPGRADQERRYLRSDLTHLGTAVPTIRRTVRSFDREHPRVDRDGLWSLVTALWDHPLTAPVHERRMAAVELLVHHVRLLDATDAPELERLLRESRTWALVDGLAVQVVGALVLADDAGWDATLHRWAVDDDRWVRRAALLAHLPGLRRVDASRVTSDGPPAPTVAEVFDRFGALADPMLDERDPFVRKAIGWVLREAGRRHPQLVTGWLLPRANRASGLTVREAVRHLEGGDREAILAARG